MIRVLYIDLCPSPGGSNVSLLHLVSHLDRRQVRPLVALAAVNPFTRFEEADGPGYAGRVQAQAEALGLGRHLHMAGFRGDIPQVLRAADVVVHCSVKPEPFGRVIIEGMAAGRPVVASALGGAAEIISDGLDGLLAPAGDAVALAAALNRLLADPEERRRLGEAAQRTVAQRYQVDAHVQAVRTFYERVLAERRPAVGAAELLPAN